MSSTRSCPACTSTDSRFLFQVVDTAKASSLKITDYDLLACRNCETVFTNPEPPAEDLELIYVNTPQFDYILRDEEMIGNISRTFEGFLRNLRRTAGWPRDERLNILEIGAGLAWMCKAAKDLGIPSTTVAQDITRECIEPATWVDHYLIGPLSEQDEVSQIAPYHIASMSHVIEHLLDPAVELRQVRDLLRKDGFVFLSAPHRPEGWSLDQPDRQTWQDWSYNHVPAHVQYFSEEGLRQLAERCGLRLTNWNAGHENGQSFEAWLQRAD